MNQRRPHHALLRKSAVKRLMKARGVPTFYALIQRLDECGVKKFRIDKYGIGKSAPNIDTIGALCKVLKCKPADLIQLVGGKKGVDRE